MLMPKEFLFGLYAYVRQAALSLHRAPKSDCDLLASFYSEHRIPSPHEVVQQLDRLLPGGDAAVVGPVNTTAGVLSGRFSVVDLARILELKQALDEYGRLLRGEGASSVSDRGRLRLKLSAAETYLRGKFNARRVHDVDDVEHLNATKTHLLRPLHQIVGLQWPLIESRP